MGNGFRKQRKLAIAMVLVLLMGTLLIACGKTAEPAKVNGSPAPAAGGSSAAPASAAPEKKMKEVKLSVTLWPASNTALPYVVGIGNGIFEKEGIKVTGVIPGSGGGDSVRTVLSGDIPFGDVSLTSAIQSHLAGAPIKILAGAGSVNQANFGWVAMKESKINGIKDFPGKKIGITNPGSAGEGILLLSLKKAGIDKNSVKIVPAGGVNEGLTLLEHGEIDVAYNPSSFTFPLERQNKWKIVLGFNEFAAEDYSTVLVTSPQLIKQDPELVQKMLNAYNKSVDFMYANPDEAAKAFADIAKVDMDRAKATIKSAVDVKQFVPFKISAAGFNNVIESMVLNGTLKEKDKISWQEMIVQDYIPEANRIDLKGLMLGNSK